MRKKENAGGRARVKDSLECQIGLRDGRNGVVANLDEPRTFRASSPVLHLCSGSTGRHSSKVEATTVLEQAETSIGMGDNVQFLKVEGLFESIIVWVW